MRLWISALKIAAVLVWVSTIAWADMSFEFANGRVVKPLERFRECDVCPEMIVMPTGSFMMGAIPGESRNRFTFYGKDAKIGMRGPDEINIMPSEHPRHQVVMDIPFAIARNETTYSEWMACVQEGGCSHTPEHIVLTLNGYVSLGPQHPVINISYIDALEYVAWLNELVGADVYRLPTEAEWEYAARAGTQTRFAQGDELTAKQANFSRDATEHLRQSPMPELVNLYKPVPVDELDAENAWGLRHMSGNVGELTLSCWSEEHLGLESDSAYLQLSKTQTSCRRVEKGGAFSSAMDSVRLANRYRPLETYRANNLGFRIIRELHKE